MTIYASLSVSLDGFYTAPDPSPHQMLGIGGEPLHAWFAHDVADRHQLSADEIVRADLERLGAMIMGRDSYEHAQAAWGPHPPFEVPIFVLTHRGREDDVRERTTFHFVTEGFDEAVERAEAIAGNHDIGLHGGGAIQQGIQTRALRELQVHLVPALLGQGRQLFKNLGGTQIELLQANVAEGNGVVHINYRIEYI